MHIALSVSYVEESQNAVRNFISSYRRNNQTVQSSKKKLQKTFKKILYRGLKEHPRHSEELRESMTQCIKQNKFIFIALEYGPCPYFSRASRFNFLH